MAAAAGIAATLAVPAGAQNVAPVAQSSMKVHLPPDAPLALMGGDWGESQTSERGSATVLDLHTTLSLRNTSQQRIRGITLLVQSQEVTPGGRASITKASLDVAPGESFPVRLDLRLLRPLARGTAPLVEVTLDGVLFDNLSFYGPNRLDSRRVMTVYELEAQRDRRHLWSVLQSQGLEGLQKECLASLARQADMPRLDVQLARGRATNAEGGRQIQFAFLRFPESPVEPVAGMARVSGGEARAPQLELRNRSRLAVRHIEVGWILKDRNGREFLAGSVPAHKMLAPGQNAEVLEETSLRFSERAGAPLAIDGMTGFVSQVEFQDGSVWIPSRTNLSDPQLRGALAPSAEEQRLTGLYRKRGLAAVAEELRRLMGSK
jgi:hypothetical protein